ncbi:MAG: trypsin-like peptidase domain-containing protein [bacterium]|nr:trypsin-like peptidase domain-containing protein [bacterium]
MNNNYDNFNMENYNVDNNMGNNNEGKPEKPKKKSNKVVRGIAYTLIFGLAAGGTFGGASYVYRLNNTKVVSTQTPNQSEASSDTLVGNNSTNSAAILNTSNVTTASIDDVSGVASEVMPSIVSITCNSTTTASDYFGQSQSQEAVSAGTGIIVSQDSEKLYIATNNHVVSGANSVKLTFSDDSTVDAEVRGTMSSSDLAVVQCNLSDLSDATKSTIRVATLGSSDDSKVGEMVVAIGNALGYGQSVTVGYLSAKDREVQTDDYTMKLLQTDAAINPGNSGGALLNASGQVIGINSVKYSSTEVEGIGYAIPISYAIPIINQLISTEKIADEDKGYLGVRFYEVEQAYSSAFGIPEGVYVTSVVSGSPADKGGLQAGDVITAIDGATCTTSSAFQEVLGTKAANTEVTFTLQRGEGNSYKETTVKVTLGKKSDYQSSQDSSSNSGSNSGSGSSSGRGSNGGSSSQNPYYYYYGQNN